MNALFGKLAFLFQLLQPLKGLMQGRQVAALLDHGKHFAGLLNLRP